MDRKKSEEVTKREDGVVTASCTNTHRTLCQAPSDGSTISESPIYTAAMVNDLSCQRQETSAAAAAIVCPPTASIPNSDRQNGSKEPNIVTYVAYMRFT